MTEEDQNIMYHNDVESRAMDMLKDEIGGTLMDNFDECYTRRVKHLGFWSGEFQSKRNPSMEEIDYFFFMKM